MRCKVENDIHVGLVEPEVQTCAIKVEQLPEVTPLHEITQLMHGRVMLEGVAGHEHHAGRVSRLDEQPRRIGRGRHRFFYEYMLACRYCFQAKLRVAGWRCGDDDRINMRQGLFEVGIYGHAMIYLRLAVIDLGKPLVHADHRRYPRRRPQHAYVPRTPITHSYDADPNSIGLHLHQTPPCRASSPLSGTFCLFFWSLTYVRLKRHPRTSGHTYVRLG